MDAGVEGVAGVQVHSITCPDALGKARGARRIGHSLRGSWRCHDHEDESDMLAVASTVCAKNLHDSVSAWGPINASEYPCNQP